MIPVITLILYTQITPTGICSYMVIVYSTISDKPVTIQQVYSETFEALSPYIPS